MGVRGLVAGLVAVGLVATGAYVADGMARSDAERQVADVLSRQLALEDPPQVSIEGFPFLPQLLARSLDDVRATAADVTFDGITVTDVAVRATDVPLASPYTAGTVRLDATVTTQSVQQEVGERTGMQVAVDGAVLRATGELLGIPLTAALVPRVADGLLLVDVEEVTLGAGTLQLEQLPGDVAERLVGIEVPLAGLPAGLALEQATVVPAGVRFTAAGSQVALEPQP